MQPGIYQMRESEYRPLPFLNWSTFKRAGIYSPLRNRAYLDAPPAKSSRARIIGQGVHAMLLEPQHVTETIVALPFDSRRTKEARQWCSERESAGVHIVSAAELAAIRRCADVALSHKLASRLIKRADCERVAIWNEHVVFDDGRETDVTCKAKIDGYLAVPHRDDDSHTAATTGFLIFDLKTTGNVDPEPFLYREALRTPACYHAQLAWYGHGLRSALRQSGENAPPVYGYWWIAVDQASGETNVIVCPQQRIDEGTDIWRRALRLWTRATVDDVYPGRLPDDRPHDPG